MVTMGLDEARADIAGLLDRAERGEDVLITREPRPSTVAEDGDTMEQALRELDKLRASLPPREQAERGGDTRDARRTPLMLRRRSTSIPAS